MRHLICVLCLVLALSFAAIGGEVDTPGKQSPTPTPTPCEGCSTSTATAADTDASEVITLELLQIVLGLVWP